MSRVNASVSSRARHTPKAQAAGPKPRATNRLKADGFEAAPKKAKPEAQAAEGLRPFASYYPESRKVPSLKPGETLDKLNDAELKAFHRLYWSAGPALDLDQFRDLLSKAPEFAKRKEPLKSKQLVRIMSKLPESFPWGWRARDINCSSHAVVDALLRAPRGTSFTDLVAQLGKKHKGFPTVSTIHVQASGSWQNEPERFPFLSALPKGPDGRPLLQAQAAAEGLPRDAQGFLRVSRQLADQVIEAARDPRIHHDFSREDFIDLVNEKIGGGFTANHLKRLAQQFNDCPNMSEIQLFALKRHGKLIRELYEQGITENAAIRTELHEKHGLPLWDGAKITFMRRRLAELGEAPIPEFRKEKIAKGHEGARAFLDEVKSRPDETYVEVARSLGMSDRDLANTIFTIRRNWPEELPSDPRLPYSKDDIAALKKAMDAVPLNASTYEVLEELRANAPEFIARHPITTNMGLAHAVKTHLGVDSWDTFQRQRYAKAFAEIVTRSPPGTSLIELARQMEELYEGAYSPAYLQELAQTWRASPKDFPEIARLMTTVKRDGVSSKVFPWDVTRTALTKELAEHVGELMKAKPGLTHRDYILELKKDKTFAKAYPNFSAYSFSALRAQFPRLVPYVTASHFPRSESSANVKALSTKIEKVAQKLLANEDNPVTLRAIAKELDEPVHRVMYAVRADPERFPWYRQIPTGTLDLNLASMVAYEMERLPIGSSVSDLISRLEERPGFRDDYPAFSPNSLYRLRDRYPEIVPDFYPRDRILRSKMIVDALATAPKGTSFRTVIRELQKQHPGVFDGYDRPSKLVQLWSEDPERYAFTSILKGPKGSLDLVGKGIESPGNAEPNEELATRLSKLEAIPTKLPLLDALSKTIGKETFENFEVLAVQHLLDSQVPTFETYRKLGMSPARTNVVAVPYSANPTVIDKLRDQGWNIDVPPLDIERWTDDIRNAILRTIEAAKAGNRKIIALDDGGLVSELVHHDPELQPHAHLFRIVEQTRRGITVADGIELKTPVVNVAQSWGKFVEGPMIAGSIDDKLKARLARIGIKTVANKQVGVIGFGTIGKPIAESLKALGAKVTVLDVDAAALKEAQRCKFKVSTDRAEFFGNQDIIIGATGVRSVTAEDVEHLKDGTVLGSASSKLVEIDVAALAEASKKKGKKKAQPEVIDKQSHPPTVRYELGNGSRVSLLASGFPLNFDGDTENIPAEDIQLTRGLMLIGAVQAADTKAAGVTRLSNKLQMGLLDKFAALRTGELKGEQAEALSTAQLNLRADAAKKTKEFRGQKRNRVQMFTK